MCNVIPMHIFHSSLKFIKQVKEDLEDQQSAFFSQETETKIKTYEQVAKALANQVQHDPKENGKNNASFPITINNLKSRVRLWNFWDKRSPTCILDTDLDADLKEMHTNLVNKEGEYVIDPLESVSSYPKKIKKISGFFQEWGLSCPETIDTLLFCRSFDCSWNRKFVFGEPSISDIKQGHLKIGMVSKKLFHYSFTESITLLGHELGHAAIQILGDEKGIPAGEFLRKTVEAENLNEHLADVLGIVACHKLEFENKEEEFKEQASWEIAENFLVVPTESAKAHIRSMKEPGKAYNYYAEFDYEKEVLPSDFKNSPMGSPAHRIYTNLAKGADYQLDSIKDYFTFDLKTKPLGWKYYFSGILNKAFYLTTKNLKRPSWEEPIKIWVAAVKKINQPHIGFCSFAYYTIKSADELGIDTQIVLNAWKSVGFEEKDLKTDFNSKGYSSNVDDSQYAFSNCSEVKKLNIISKCTYSSKPDSQKSFQTEDSCDSSSIGYYSNSPPNSPLGKELSSRSLKKEEADELNEENPPTEFSLDQSFDMPLEQSELSEKRYVYTNYCDLTKQNIKFVMSDTRTLKKSYRYELMKNVTNHLYLLKLKFKIEGLIQEIRIEHTKSNAYNDKKTLRLIFKISDKKDVEIAYTSPIESVYP